MVICRTDLTYLKCDQCCLQESDFKMVISQLTELFITFFKTSLERRALEVEFPDRANDLVEIFNK